jgi:hypothetical protein
MGFDRDGNPIIKLLGDHGETIWSTGTGQFGDVADSTLSRRFSGERLSVTIVQAASSDALSG